MVGIHFCIIKKFHNKFIIIYNIIRNQDRGSGLDFSIEIQIHIAQNSSEIKVTAKLIRTTPNCTHWAWHFFSAQNNLIGTKILKKFRICSSRIGCWIRWNSIHKYYQLNPNQTYSTEKAILLRSKARSEGARKSILKKSVLTMFKYVPAAMRP